MCLNIDWGEQGVIKLSYKFMIRDIDPNVSQSI